MNTGLKYGLSTGIRLFVCSMAIFFTLLAVLDSFVKRPDIVYSGEFVSEAEFKFIELPNTLQIPSGNKISKLDKIEVIQLSNFIFFLALDLLFIEMQSVDKTAHIFLPKLENLKYSLNTHAP
ncbi:hypothetical protein MMU07_06315 [Aquiflexum sp. LQ15W]|uniref:hypothetical protein n=1 Tax=Cognataquiflexum nitidum TaxID=2922272 RepID=UPI001F133F2E|nr:hypothetical protein [Cognataquiflexum nitidum]MCH6199181.1 hypothetical protein [Cognataquiflexum nitidum]